MPGPARTLTSILETRGSFISHKDRKTARANEPVPTEPLGCPPKHLSPEEKKIWAEIKKQVPEGVLFYPDRLWMELTTKLVFKLRNGTLLSADRSQLMNLLGHMGMNPADRSKVAAKPAAPKEDEWLELDTPKLIT